MQNLNFIGSISYLLNQISTFYYAKLEKSLSSIGLHYGQVYILIALWEKDNQTQKQLADRISVSPPTVNKMIKSLAQNGFVAANRCADDTRAVRITLTEKGIEIRERVELIWVELEGELFSDLNETEKLILSQVLTKIRDGLSV